MISHNGCFTFSGRPIFGELNKVWQGEHSRPKPQGHQTLSRQFWFWSRLHTQQVHSCCRYYNVQRSVCVCVYMQYNYTDTHYSSLEPRLSGHILGSRGRLMRIIWRAPHLLPIMVNHFLFIKPDKLSTRHAEGISQFYHERNYSNCMKVGYNY